MAQIQSVLHRDNGAEDARRAKHKLDELDADRVAKNLVLFDPSRDEVAALMEKSRPSIPGLGKTENIQNILDKGFGRMFGLARKSRFDPKSPKGEGYILILLLNEIGLLQLALGTINGPNPDLRLLADPHERPAGIYMWCVYAPGPLAAGIALFMEAMKASRFEGINLYSRPNTDLGVRYNQALGLVPGAPIGPIRSEEVWYFDRQPQTPLYDSYVPGAGTREIGISVARTFEDMMRVAAVRNVVYMGEQECPYFEEYDGNDFAATHLLAYIGDEPAGCLRLRFFADFAKFERVAIRKEFRKSRAAIKLVQAGLKLCQKKGYRRVIGHAQTRLTIFWTRFGFQPMPDRKHFFFSDYDYIEMVAELEPDPKAITITADPYVAIRPEGRWHVPGILEASLSRPATNPSVKKS